MDTGAAGLICAGQHAAASKGAAVFVWSDRPPEAAAVELDRHPPSPAAFKMALGEIYNLTKKKEGGTGANQHKKEQLGKNCPAAPKPPNTAKAIADKAGVSRRPITPITTITGAQGVTAGTAATYPKASEG